MVKFYPWSRNFGQHRWLGEMIIKLLKVQCLVYRFCCWKNVYIISTNTPVVDKILFINNSWGSEILLMTFFSFFNAFKCIRVSKFKIFVFHQKFSSGCSSINTCGQHGKKDWIYFCRETLLLCSAKILNISFNTDEKHGRAAWWQRAQRSMGQGMSAS